MINWGTAICVAGIALSLWFVCNGEKQTGTAKSFSALIQTGVWLLLWWLFSPPAVLPQQISLTLDTPLSKLPGAGIVAALDNLKLTGDGLSRDTLRDLPPVRLQHREQTERPGWRVHWSRELRLGDPLVVEIQLKSGRQAPVHIALEDPFGNESASAELSMENPSITLRAEPRLSGSWLYQVRIDDRVGSNSTSRREVIPVNILEPDSPHVLLWLARPGFESAALGRWLRESGTPTQVVTQLAPEMQRHETLNGQRLHEGPQFASDAPFDLLILDSHLWPQLSAAERAQLAALPGNKSLLWLVGEKSSTEFIDYARDRGFPLQKTERTTATYPTFVGNEEQPPLQLVSFTPATIRVGDARIHLVADRTERNIYWARINPQQSLGFVLFNNSYRWQTSGHKQEFAQLWDQILSQQLSLRGTVAPITSNTSLPLEAHRLQLCSPAFTDQPTPLRFAGDETSGMAAWQPPVIAKDYPSRGCHDYWPQQPGWYGVGDTGKMLYIFAQTAWPEWQTEQVRADSDSMRSARLGQRPELAHVQKTPPLRWLILALLALLVLTWYRERPTLR